MLARFSHLDYVRRYAVTQELLAPFSFDRADSGFCLPCARTNICPQQQFDDMHPFHSYACRTYQRQDRAPELPCLQY
jgi:hypothetical protein